MSKEKSWHNSQWVKYLIWITKFEIHEARLGGFSYVPYHFFLKYVFHKIANRATVLKSTWEN